MNAQTRAKIARAQSDIRTIVQAIRMYSLDRNFYPVKTGNMDERYIPLTTPVSYMSSVPLDPFNKTPKETGFGKKDLSNPKGNYDYWTRYWANQSKIDGTYWNAQIAFPANKFEWQLRGFGPTAEWIGDLVYPVGHEKAGLYIDYEPSNGLLSKGNIVSYGP